MAERLTEYDVFLVRCDRIYFNTEFNCRGIFTSQSVSDLAESIRELGRLLIPLWVQPAVDVPGLPEGYDCQLLAGHRRFRAVTEYLGWKTVPATIMHGLSVHQARIINFTENLERNDLNPLEEAIAIKRLVESQPKALSQRQIARMLKKDTTWVRHRTRLLLLPEEVQDMVAARRVALCDLDRVFKQTTPAKQIDAAQTIANSKRGRGKKRRPLDVSLIRSFKLRRSKADINKLIEQMLTAGVQGLAPRVLAWCAGYLSDEDIQSDLSEYCETSADV